MALENKYTNSIYDTNIRENIRISELALDFLESVPEIQNDKETTEYLNKAIEAVGDFLSIVEMKYPIPELENEKFANKKLSTIFGECGSFDELRQVLDNTEDITDDEYDEILEIIDDTEEKFQDDFKFREKFVAYSKRDEYELESEYVNTAITRISGIGFLENFNNTVLNDDDSSDDFFDNVDETNYDPYMGQDFFPDIDTLC